MTLSSEEELDNQKIQYDSDGEPYEDIGLGRPKLETPFYQALRERYPKAFRRRLSVPSTSLNSSRRESCCSLTLDNSIKEKLDKNREELRKLFSNTPRSCFGQSPTPLRETEFRPIRNDMNQTESVDRDSAVEVEFSTATLSSRNKRRLTPPLHILDSDVDSGIAYARLPDQIGSNNRQESSSPSSNELDLEYQINRPKIRQGPVKGHQNIYTEPESNVALELGEDEESLKSFNLKILNPSNSKKFETESIPSVYSPSPTRLEEKESVIDDDALFYSALRNDLGIGKIGGRKGSFNPGEQMEAIYQRVAPSYGRQNNKEDRQPLTKSGNGNRRAPKLKGIVSLTPDIGPETLVDEDTDDSDDSLSQDYSKIPAVKPRLASTATQYDFGTPTTSIISSIGTKSISRPSLSKKLDDLKNGAKNKFSKLRKAMSMDKLNVPKNNDHYIFEETPITHDHSMKKSKTKSLLNLTEKLGLKKKNKKPRDIELPTGRLVTVHGDGSHHVELSRPAGQPFGFYIAKGNQKTNGGLFISRLSQNIPPSTFDGLLSLGDEILMINDIPIKRLSIDDVYEIFGRENIIELRLLPYSSRKENVIL